MKKATFFLVLALVLVMAAPSLAQEPVQLRYWLWDTLQMPGYEACAAEFEAQNPNIDVVVEQLGWGDYWPTLQTNMIAGGAPDVFTNWIGQTPEFVDRGLIVDIQPLVERDNVPTDIYIGSTADLWVHEGSRYGLPKDWDTVAIVYNADMLEAAGIDPAVMDTWTWNPEDGGEFEQVVAQLTLDANGNNGLSPDFDPANVVQYGFIQNAGTDAYGKTAWGPFAVSNGFFHQDEPWSSEYNYNDPALAEALGWLRSLWLEKGYAPPYSDVLTQEGTPLFLAGEGAMIIQGSWMVNSFVGSDINFGFGRLPAGPEGLPRTATNSLGDSIWTGTPNPDEAWEWVKFLASPECQVMVGETGAVFPATAEGTQAVIDLREEQGIDVSVFFEMADEPGVTYYDPVGGNFSVVTEVMSETMSSILLGLEEDVQAALDAAMEEISFSME